MSERRSTKAILLVVLMLASVVGQAAANEQDESPSEIEEDMGVVYGDLSLFDASQGSEYLLIEEDVPVVSATSFIKQAWICLLYTSPSPRDATLSRMPSSA